MPLLSDHEVLVIAEMPKLRLLALKLCKNPTAADDLVQETVCRALKHQAQFEENTVIGAWMWTIMRNYFHSEYRRAWRTVEDPDDVMVLKLSCPPDQHVRLEAQEALAAVCSLPYEFSRALLMIGDGATYQEIADECGAHEGTVKSRVSRGRALLEGRELP